MLEQVRMKLHHYRLWHAEVLQLLQEFHLLLGFIDDGADVHLPLEVLGYDEAQELGGLHHVHCRGQQVDG